MPRSDCISHGVLHVVSAQVVVAPFPLHAGRRSPYEAALALPSGRETTFPIISLQLRPRSRPGAILFCVPT